MREKLRTLYNSGTTTMDFIGTVTEICYTKDDKGKRTILIKGLENYEGIIEDHVWLLKEDIHSKYIKKNLSKVIGEKIEFTADIKRYYKRRNKDSYLDYNITNLRNIKFVNAQQSIAM